MRIRLQVRPAPTCSQPRDGGRRPGNRRTARDDGCERQLRGDGEVHRHGRYRLDGVHAVVRHGDRHAAAAAPRQTEQAVLARRQRRIGFGSPFVPSPTGTHGRFQLVNDGKWRLKGNLFVYTRRQAVSRPRSVRETCTGGTDACLRSRRLAARPLGSVVSIRFSASQSGKKAAPGTFNTPSTTSRPRPSRRPAELTTPAIAWRPHRRHLVRRTDSADNQIQQHREE